MSLQNSMPLQNSIPLPSGLINTGNTCYLNSILQALLSCQSFNEVMIILEHQNKITKLYNRILMGDCNNPVELLSAIIEKRKYKDTNLHMGHHEDANESFLMLLEEIGDDILKVFNIKHQIKLSCSCGFKNSRKDVPEIFLDYYSNEISLVKYLVYQKTHPKDYKCPSCKGIATTRLKKKIYSISNVIIITFKKYTVKDHIDFPLFINLASNLRYKLVAQIEHFGDAQGGHYITRALRQNTVYIFNDNSVTPSSFVPTPDTYMIFYHKI